MTYEASVHHVRPRKATVSAVLLIVFGVVGLLYTLLLWGTVNDEAGHGQSVSPVAYVLVLAQFLVSGAQVVSGAFVWRGRGWARVLAIALNSLNIVGAVISLFTGAVVLAIPAIAINIGMIRLLTDYEVQAWCDR